MTNPSSRVRAGSPITISRPRPLRGEAKLRAALSAFAVDPSGRTALDVGAAAGGFTRVLLGAGARRVYAVDVGHGQLLGSLRQDSRVVHLERTNLAGLDEDRVPDVVDLVTIDVSYLALSSAAPQLERIRLAPDVEAIALVKPQFELGLASPPEDRVRARSGSATRRPRIRRNRLGRRGDDGVARPRLARGGRIPAPRREEALARRYRP